MILIIVERNGSKIELGLQGKMIYRCTHALFLTDRLTDTVHTELGEDTETKTGLLLLTRMTTLA